MRAKLGGGSFTTINRVCEGVLWLTEGRRRRRVGEVPGDLVEIGQRAGGQRIYAAVQRQASSKIELIEADSRKQIDAADAPAESGSGNRKRGSNRRRRPRPPRNRPAADALARPDRAEAGAARAGIEHSNARDRGRPAECASRSRDQEAQKRALRRGGARRLAEAESHRQSSRLQKALRPRGGTSPRWAAPIGKRLTKVAAAAEAETATARRRARGATDTTLES